MPCHASASSPGAVSGWRHVPRLVRDNDFNYPEHPTPKKGDFLYVPPGVIHGFSNESGAGARMLILFAPGPPREEYFTKPADILAGGKHAGSFGKELHVLQAGSGARAIGYIWITPDVSA